MFLPNTMQRSVRWLFDLLPLRIHPSPVNPPGIHDWKGWTRSSATRSRTCYVPSDCVCMFCILSTMHSRNIRLTSMFPGNQTHNLRDITVFAFFCISPHFDKSGFVFCSPVSQSCRVRGAAFPGGFVQSADRKPEGLLTHESLRGKPIWPSNVTTPPISSLLSAAHLLFS